MWTIAWNILVSLAKSKIGRVLIGLAIIGFFYAGFRIWLPIHDASVAREATSQMVTKFERDTLASQLTEERRRAQQAARITDEYRKRTHPVYRRRPSDLLPWKTEQSVRHPCY
ncbi:hypothetical protein [Rhizobium sp. R693]|uniref:hypothetical protein n=1 Tax=Rhizobium sp. R693 TaxID=1764276 RepID=UPI001131E02C|nr:hypothetical protein [Rhizobium sp. R693]